MDNINSDELKAAVEIRECITKRRQMVLLPIFVLFFE
jgi:hypothetical protein